MILLWLSYSNIFNFSDIICENKFHDHNTHLFVAFNRIFHIFNVRNEICVNNEFMFIVGLLHLLLDISVKLLSTNTFLINLLILQRVYILLPIFQLKNDTKE